MMLAKASLTLLTAAILLLSVEAKSLDAGKNKSPGRRSSYTSRLLKTPPPPHDKNPTMQSCWYEEAVSPNYDDDDDDDSPDGSGVTRPVSSSSSSRRRSAAKQNGNKSSRISGAIDSLRGGSSAMSPSSSSAPTVTTTTVTSTTTTAQVEASTPSSSSVSSIASKSSSKLSMFIAKQAMKQTALCIQNQFLMLKNGELTTKEVVLTVGVVITAIAAIVNLIMLGDDGGLFSADTWVCWSCIILGPLAAILQRKVFILEDLRDITNQMENQVLELQTSNAKLQKQNSRLHANTERLQSAKTTLDHISQSQGISIETLVEQVQDYKEIRSSIHSDLRGRIQNTILNVMERSDKDMDYIIDDNEMDLLISNLRLLPGVTFDEQKLRTALSSVKGDLSDFFDQHVSIRKESTIFQFQ